MTITIFDTIWANDLINFIEIGPNLSKQAGCLANHFFSELDTRVHSSVLALHTSMLLLPKGDFYERMQNASQNFFSMYLTQPHTLWPLEFATIFTGFNCSIFKHAIMLDKFLENKALLCTIWTQGKNCHLVVVQKLN